MAKKQRRLHISQSQKQKLKVTTKMIFAGSASIFGLVAGIFVYINLSQTEESKAKSFVQPDALLIEADFAQPKLLVAPPEARLNGQRVKQVKEINTVQ